MAFVVAHDGALAKFDVAGAPAIVVAEDSHERGFLGIDKRAPDRFDGLSQPAVSVHDEEAPAQQGQRGELSLSETRPWQPTAPITELKLNYDFTGPEEEGLSRAERRQTLEAA